MVQINTKVDKERIEEIFINKEIMIELFPMVEGVIVDLNEKIQLLKFIMMKCCMTLMKMSRMPKL